MARRKSLRDIEIQRLRIQDAINAQARNVTTNREYDRLNSRANLVDRIARTYSTNIQRANGWRYMPNSFYGDPEKIRKKISPSVYRGLRTAFGSQG